MSADIRIHIRRDIIAIQVRDPRIRAIIPIRTRQYVCFYTSYQKPIFLKFTPRQRYALLLRIRQASAENRTRNRRDIIAIQARDPRIRAKMPNRTRQHDIFFARVVRPIVIAIVCVSSAPC